MNKHINNIKLKYSFRLFGVDSSLKFQVSSAKRNLKSLIVNLQSLIVNR